MKKIYSKFVKERKKEFQIETALWQDEGVKFITKRSLFPEGKPHINHIYETYEMYRDENILCESSMIGDHQISFSYVSGDTLETKMLHAFDAGNQEEVQHIVMQYDKILNRVCHEEEKAVAGGNPEFETVFGMSEGTKEGYQNAIFDLTFDNIIFCGEDYRIIDYEWRFRFAVEKEFIKFRAVYAFYIKYGDIVNRMYSQEEFYQLFGLDNVNEDCDRYVRYNEKFIGYVYGDEGYNHVLEKYKKATMNVCDNRAVHAMKVITEYDKGNELLFEGKIYEMLLNSIREHQQFYDDYQKFFTVTDKLRDECQLGYLLSKEFYEEFSAYITGFYEMLEYFHNQVMEKQKIIDELFQTIDRKDEENRRQEEKYSRDFRMLTDKSEELMTKNIALEQKLEYIRSCKIYKAFLNKKVEERFG
jgi:hypothetical protein